MCVANIIIYLHSPRRLQTLQRTNTGKQTKKRKIHCRKRAHKHANSAGVYINVVELIRNIRIGPSFYRSFIFHPWYLVRHLPFLHFQATDSHRCTITLLLGLSCYSSISFLFSKHCCCFFPMRTLISFSATAAKVAEVTDQFQTNPACHSKHRWWALCTWI